MLEVIGIPMEPGGFPGIPFSAPSTPSIFPSGLKALPAMLREHLARLGLAYPFDFKSIVSSIHIICIWIFCKWNSYHMSTMRKSIEHLFKFQDFIEIVIRRIWNRKGKYRTIWKTNHFPPEIVACGQRAAQKPIWSLESPPTYQWPAATRLFLCIH